VILSTHLLPEVTAICDRVAILHQGRLRHDAPLDDGHGRLRLTLATPVDASRIANLPPVAEVIAEAPGIYRVSRRQKADAPALSRAVVEAGLSLVGLQVTSGSLDRAFMDIATRSERVAQA
jgi:ABC-2 type transport system ATP-binding protein